MLDWSAAPECCHTFFPESWRQAKKGRSGVTPLRPSRFWPRARHRAADAARFALRDLQNMPLRLLGFRDHDAEQAVLEFGLGFINIDLDRKHH